VALGAAVQAGLKSGALSAKTGIMITDICPYTLGVEVSTRAGSQLVDGMFSPIIPRNSTIPVSRTEIYSTTGDGQAQVDVKVFQGEDRLVKNDVFLDQYRVDGIPPGPAGSERVAVTFTYDVNGILHVRTKVVSTGKEALLRVDRSAQRMTPPERAAAKARIDQEWKPASSTGGGAASIPPLSPTGGEGATPARGEGSTPEVAELRDLARAARSRREGTPPAVAERLATLAAELDGALDRGDAARASAVAAELTDALFDLG